MNIRTNEAGSVDESHFRKRGFFVYDVIKGNDMGQCSFRINQYKNEQCTIEGGYWTWYVKDKEGKFLFEGWWNTNDEFDQTMNELGIDIGL